MQMSMRESLVISCYITLIYSDDRTAFQEIMTYFITHFIRTYTIEYLYRLRSPTRYAEDEKNIYLSLAPKPATHKIRCRRRYTHNRIFVSIAFITTIRRRRKKHIPTSRSHQSRLRGFLCIIVCWNYCTYTHECCSVSVCVLCVRVKMAVSLRIFYNRNVNVISINA